MTVSDWCDESLHRLLCFFVCFLAFGGQALHSIIVQLCLTLLCSKRLVTGRKSSTVSEPGVFVTSDAKHIITRSSLVVRLLLLTKPKNPDRVEEEEVTTASVSHMCKCAAVDMLLKKNNTQG